MTSLLRQLRRHIHTTLPFRRCQATSAPSHIRVLGETYPTDDFTNLSPSISSKLSKRLHTQKGHPIATLRSLIENHFPNFTHLSSLSPIVTPYQNFDSLSFPLDHPGRAKTDSYYINRNTMLRTHTSAHEVEVFAKGMERWLLTADVYRRDEIDASHYPVFHQMEGAKIFSNDPSSIEQIEKETQRLERQLAASNIVTEDVQHISRTNPVQTSHNVRSSEVTAKNLKLCLNSLLYELFAGVAGASKDDPLRVRWIEAYFPFTSPSYEVEVFFRGKWLEILGCGVVLQSTLDRAGTISAMSDDFSLKSCCRRRKQNGLGFWPWSRTYRYDSLLHSRYPLVLVRRPSVSLPVYTWKNQHLQTVLQVSRDLQGYQLLEAEP